MRFVSWAKSILGLSETEARREAKTVNALIQGTETVQAEVKGVRIAVKRSPSRRLRLADGESRRFQAIKE